MAGTNVREALLALALSFNRRADPGCVWDQPSGGPLLRPGDDYNARGVWDDLLSSTGAEPVIRRGDEVLWRRPGKDGRTWSASTGHCRTPAGQPLLHVFTSSWPPFLPGKTYSLFAAYALLNYGGDYRAAAKALAAEGFGEQQRQAGSRGGSPPREPATPRPEPSIPDEEPWPQALRPEAWQGLAGAICRKIEPQTEADPIAVLVQLLVMFGNVCGRHAYWRVENDRHYANLFCCLVGASSVGRKGTSKGRALQAFGTLEDDWAKKRIVSGLSSGEGLIHAVRDEVYKREPIKERGRIVSYQEVMVDEGVHDKRLLVVESEFALALRATAREGNTLSPRIREAWDSGMLGSLTKTSQCRATGAHISIIGHITRTELVRELGQVEAANGFANRFLWVACQRSKLLPFGGDHVDLAPLDHKLALAVEQARRRDEEVGMDLDAREWFADGLYERLTHGQPGLVGKALSRAEAQVRRLALIYALLDFSETVRYEHLAAAVAVWDYCAQSARWAFGGSTGDSVADTILAALKEVPEGMNQRELFDLLGRHTPAEKLGQALALLKEAGQVMAVDYKPEGGKGGRPGKRWIFVFRGCEQTSKPPFGASGAAASG